MAQRQRQRRIRCNQRRGWRRWQRVDRGLDPAENLEQHRRGQIAAKHPGHRRAIRAPDPDARHMPPVKTQRPGIAVAIGCAGFIGQSIAWRARRRRDIR